MDAKQFKEWVSLMERLKVKRLHIKEKNGKELDIERECAHLHTHREVVPHAVHSEAPLKVQETSVTGNAREKDGTFIKSPMVGTLYLAPSPSEGAFVKVGDKVTADTIVCIVEAMKVMNEVKAGHAGVIKEICMDNQQAVEFGTELFRIET